MQSNRFYRKWVETNLTKFEVKIDESDIFFLADKDLTETAKAAIIKYREELEAFIERDPDFQSSLVPIRLETGNLSVPHIVRRMLSASQKAGVGPMAGVAGAIAEFTGRDLMSSSSNVIVENGGDIFIKTVNDRDLAIFAGGSPLSGKIGIRIHSGDTPLGVCTSSGTVGHSLSLGLADAVVVVSKDAILADAAATAVCNKVRSETDIEGALHFSKKIEGVIGCVVIYRDRIGSIGKIELV